jgi:hypothetical protein
VTNVAREQRAYFWDLDNARWIAQGKRPAAAFVTAPEAFGVGGVLIFLAIGVLFTAGFATKYRQQWLLEQEAVDVQGTVVSAQSRANDDGEGSYAEVTYRFEPPGGGAPRQQTASLTHEEGDRLKAGDPFPVRYLPSRPDQPLLPRPASGQTWGENLFPAAAGSICSGFFVFCLFVILVKWRARLRREKGGVVLPGQVVTCDGCDDSEDRFQMTVTYAFTNPAGIKFTGQQSDTRNDLRGEPMPAAGTPVHVLYLDDGNFALM